MRFYFDFVDGAYSTHDREGHELDSADEARCEVLKALPEVLLLNTIDTDEREVACSVRDEHGTVVVRASVMLKAQRSPNH